MSQWFIQSVGRIGYYAIADAEGTIVCHPSPMGERNARLIVAAPELLAALQDIARQPEGDEQSAQAVAREVLNKLGV